MSFIYTCTVITELLMMRWRILVHNSLHYYIKIAVVVMLQTEYFVLGNDGVQTKVPVYHCLLCTVLYCTVLYCTILYLVQYALRPTSVMIVTPAHIELRGVNPVLN